MAQPATDAAPMHVVVRSIGNAGFGVVKALEGLCPMSSAEIAACLYRAPGILFRNLAPADARTLADRLAETGLEIDLLPASAPFTPGTGELELALEVQDYARMGELLRLIIHLLGLDGRSARDLISSSPCQLLGSVSAASAEAIARRFTGQGASIQVIDPKASRYDVYVIATAPQLSARIVDNLRATGRIATGPAGSAPSGPFVVSDLSYTEASQLWDELGRRGDAIRIFNQALERFDVVLTACSSIEALAGPLVQLSGMPATAVGRVIERLPVVVLSNIPLQAARDALVALGQAGATAHAELVALQTFSLRIVSCPQPQAAAKVLFWLADVPAADAEAVLRRADARFDGPFTAVRARWIQQELTALGATVRLEKR